MRADRRQMEIVELVIKLALAVLIVCAMAMATDNHSIAAIAGFILTEAMVLGYREARTNNLDKYGLFGFVVLILRAIMTGFCNFVGWVVDLAMLIQGEVEQ